MPSLADRLLARIVSCVARVKLDYRERRILERAILVALGAVDMVEPVYCNRDLRLAEVLAERLGGLAGEALREYIAWCRSVLETPLYDRVEWL